MAVVVEAQAAPDSIQPLPADPGRAVGESDLPIGQSELILFELPAEGSAPDAAPRIFAAASNTGLWKRLPVELKLGSEPLPSIELARRAVLGRTETMLEGRCPSIRDDLSTVTVNLANGDQLLVNADMNALMAGANLALIGKELIQFGRAEHLGTGHYHLSKLLRGRRGTEWAATTHSIGEKFCLVDPAAMRSVNLSASAIGAVLTATAHGIGDVTPLPTADRLITGEALRPPSPCHLRVARADSTLWVSWIRRSFQNWAWADALGDSPDAFPERYRITIEGSTGQAFFETTDCALSLNHSQLPGQPGQSLAVSVVTVGSAALSHPASATIIL
jgi:hypothetical protein